jgi:hypothetical protein
MVMGTSCSSQNACKNVAVSAKKKMMEEENKGRRRRIK